jgi:histidyl-tRNA synthetase
MADKAEKSNKLKPRLPRGLADRSPGEIAATRQMIEKIRAVYELYGFEPVETPVIEYTDALGKFLPDQDRPNEGVFSFQDDDEQWLSLRYDLTAPLARYVAENFDTLPKPYRSYRVGTVFRNEKPGPGRFREFMQFDADTVGSSSPAADAELSMMAADTMEALGIPRGCYVVKVNNRKILDGLLESIGLEGDANTEKRLTVLRAVDKLDRLGPIGVLQLLTTGRKDESSDFTRGADLTSAQADNVIRYLGYSTSLTYGHPQLVRDSIERPDFKNDEAIEWIEQRVQLGPSGQVGLQELKEFARLTKSAGYFDGRVVIDPSVVRGLEYYTGPVFEIDLSFSIDTADGSPRFGSVGGGGRYDGLISRFRTEPVPATGFSIGVSRLLAALEHFRRTEQEKSLGPVLVSVFDKERIADYQKMVTELRGKGIRSELYLGSSGFNAQMKYADKRRSPCVVIQGSNEKNDPKGPKIIVKDLVLGSRLASLAEDRDAHRKKQREAEKRVLEKHLVTAVRAVLDRHTPKVSIEQSNSSKKKTKRRAQKKLKRTTQKKHTAAKRTSSNKQPIQKKTTKRHRAGLAGP